MQIILDIETIPSQKPGSRDEVRAAIKPPGTLKKAESIAAWWQLDASTAADDAYRKQSLDGGLAGEIVSIAIAAAHDDDDAGWTLCRTPEQTEAHLLAAFADAVVKRMDAGARAGLDGYNWPTDPFFIAHNASFDLGFLWRRCIVNGVALPFKLPSPAARAGKDFGCTMLAWAGFGNRVSLDALCRALGVPSPKEGGIDGAGVYDAWLAGRHAEIAAYNLRDTLATKTVWQRLQVGHSA